MLRNSGFSERVLINKKPLFQAAFERYLADSNRRPRFCRPIPNRSGKVPNLRIASAKVLLFFELTKYFLFF